MTDRAKIEQAASHFIDTREGAHHTDEEWLRDPDNAAALLRLGDVWDGFEGHLGKPELMRMAIAAQEDFQAARLDRLSTPPPQHIPREAPRRALMALAASVVLMVAGLGYHYATLPDIFETGSAERLTTRLADGSMLTLDSESKVEVDIDSDKRRFTLIEGRANFAVAKDRLRPFVVYAGNKQIIATGTEFSVELVNSEVRVVLYEGHVSVAARPEDRGLFRTLTNRSGARGNGKTTDEPVVKLDQGESLVASDAGQLSDGIIEAPDNLRQMAMWKTGQLQFDAEPLPIAIARMNRYTNRELVLGGNPALRKLTVSGVFRPGDVDAFADGVAGLYELRTVKDGDRIVLTD